jgi:hypothetical protein
MYVVIPLEVEIDMILPVLGSAPDTGYGIRDRYHGCLLLEINTQHAACLIE